MPATDVTGSPSAVRLAAHAPLRDGLQRACALVREARRTPHVTTGDPLYHLMVHELRDDLRAIVNDGVSFKVQGSAGQINFPWAETPWTAIFDRLVTESAQRGHYIVLLVHPQGTGVHLSLNQGVSAARAASGRAYRQLLVDSAARFRKALPQRALEGLIVEPLDLGARGLRTRGYEAGNVAALWLPAEAIPPDAVIAMQIRRFLGLYESVTAAVDEDDAAGRLDLPVDARSGAESKRYRWHLRAEGRNRAVVRRAKELHGYVCGVCRRDFVKELGEVGKRCVDAHHLTPFSQLDERPRQLDPRRDFAIVCANCHRLLHSETPPLLPEVVAGWRSPR